MDLEKLSETMEKLSIWRPASVSNEPETKLTQWRIYKVAADFYGNGDTIHFVGYAGYEGRVCSAVLKFDAKTRRGVTQSGRVYELVGEPGYNSDAMYVWNKWLSINGDPITEDLTDTYLEK